MKVCSLFIILFLPFISVAQKPIIHKVVAEICDTLNKYDVEALTKEESTQLIRSVLLANYDQWMQGLEEYQSSTGKRDYDYDQYFQHILKQDCKAFRIVNNKFDIYLEENDSERKLYLQAKELVYALEDNVAMDSLLKYFSDTLRNDDLRKLLTTSIDQISQIKRTTRVSIMMVYTDGYTIKVRYFDYKTDEPLFQMNAIYADTADLLFDKIEVVDRNELIEQWRERLEYMRKVKSGEIEPQLPPPPPPPPGK